MRAMRNPETGRLRRPALAMISVAAASAAALAAAAGPAAAAASARPGGTGTPAAMTAGDVYGLAGTGTAGYSGDRGIATKAEFSNPRDVAVDHAGNLVISDTENNRVRVVAGSTGTFYGKQMIKGHVYNLAGTGHVRYRGDGIPAGHANVFGPQGLAIDAAGNVVICDSIHNRVRVVAESTGTFYGQAMTAGDIYTVAGNGRDGDGGSGVPATKTAVAIPDGVAIDAAGNLVVAADGAGEVKVVAVSSGTFYGQPMTAGDVYTIAGNGDATGNGGPATSAYLPDPQCVAVDSAGNVLICEVADSRVRVVAESTATIYGQAMIAGDIYTVAGTGHQGFSGDGGPAGKATLYLASGLAVDSAGNLLIADSNNNRIRVVAGGTGTFYGQAMTDADIYTIAGTGIAGFSGDGGPALRARLRAPIGLAVNSAGDIVFADTGNNRIREVAG